jgi:nitrogen-specific signal transduction histidine kinase
MPEPASTRLIVDQSQTIVVLDTNAARNLAHELQCPSWALTLGGLNKGAALILKEGITTEDEVDNAITDDIPIS